MCLTSSKEDSLIEELDKMDKRFKEFVEMDRTSNDIPKLISNFGTLYQSRTLRRTDYSLWFGEKILNLPPVHQKDFDVAFPDQYRQALNNMTQNIAGDIQHGVNQGTLKQMMHTFYKTITRQQLLASTIPWLVGFWSGPRGNRDERLLAASYPQEHVPRAYTCLSGRTQERS